jgi:hypothetical protein
LSCRSSTVRSCKKYSGDDDMAAQCIYLGRVESR